MRRMTGLCAAVLVLAAGGRAADAPASIEGTWIIVGMEFGGTAIPEADIAKGKEEERTLKINKDQVIATQPGGK